LCELETLLAAVFARREEKEKVNGAKAADERSGSGPIFLCRKKGESRPSIYWKNGDRN